MSGPLPPLHVLVTPEAAARSDFGDLTSRMRARCGGRLALHLRLPGASGRRLFRLAERLVAEAEGPGGWVVVNERLDVALAAGADAVQLGAAALPVRTAAAVARGRLALGASVHGADEARVAARQGASYLVLGTIFGTPTHADREAGGTVRIEACRGAGPPIVAIGGIDGSRVAAVMRAGASGVAVIRAVWSSQDPVEAAAGLVEILEGGERA